jgi:putative aldouronate transport system permease protein
MFITSISDGFAVLRGEVFLTPIKPNFKAYQAIFIDPHIVKSYLNTIVYTVTGTLVNVVMTALCAYPLSRKQFYGRGFFTFLIVFTMFFDAGIIANFLVVQRLGFIDKIWAIIIPPAINVWYMIIMRTFFQGIPEEMNESAYIDGANDLTIFAKIIVPLSKPVIATMLLFYAVWHWNSFFPALLYLNKRELYPMQLVMRNIVIGSDISSMQSSVASVSVDMAILGKNIKYSVIFITIAPILIVYPFVQKHFVKGVMVGALKG